MNVWPGQTSGWLLGTRYWTCRLHKVKEVHENTANWLSVSQEFRCVELVRYREENKGDKKKKNNCALRYIEKSIKIYNRNQAQGRRETPSQALITYGLYAYIMMVINRDYGSNSKEQVELVSQQPRQPSQQAKLYSPIRKQKNRLHQFA